MSQKQSPQTLAVKAAENAFRTAKPVSTPIYLSTTFHREQDGSYKHGFVYSRMQNPNRKILEEGIAQLEQGDRCLAFSSGMAAISAIFQALRPGDHVLLPDDVYYNIYALIKEVYAPWGLSYDLVDMSDNQAIEAALLPDTKLVWLETPSNPQLKISDITHISQVVKKNNPEALIAVDNTWPSPVLQLPLALGADISVHSTTKYFGGHSDVLSGAVVIKGQEELTNRMERIQILGGAVPSPFDSWLVSRGIQTLYTRVKAQTETAMQLARFLEQHPAIEKVNYPGLESHPQHEVAKRQMPNGYGAMLSVLVKGDAHRAIEVSNKLQLFTTATSLGGVESLVEHRKSVEGEDSPTPGNLLRISIGLEAFEDLRLDWEQGLGL
ncbi:MAG: aminotransferase class I/II-fold pyridoxal phosphate-dependent enzyme [Bacteroidota bacterium]